MPISNFHVRYTGLALRRGLEERGIWESLAHRWYRWYLKTKLMDEILRKKMQHVGK